MTPEFAEALAFMIWADLYIASPPHVSSGLGGGRSLTFSDENVLLINDADHARVFDAVALDSLGESEADARKLAGWLGELLEGAHGAQHFEDCGWSAWAARGDGKVVEACELGFMLHDTMEGFLGRGACRAALRLPPRES